MMPDLKMALTFFGAIAVGTTANANAATASNAKTGNAKTGAGTPAHPNVLILLVDDMGWNDLGCTGSKFYETPNIDRLAARGVRFANGYAACSVSSPSRASILTGKNTVRHGITSWIGDSHHGQEWAAKNNMPIAPPQSVEQISDKELMIQQYLKKFGYKTFIAGKWHLGNILPQHFGFDVNKGGYSAGQPKTYFSPYGNPQLTDGPAGEDLTLRLAHETVDFIEQQAASKTPFFAYLAFYAVHAPVQTTRERWRHFRDKAESMGIVPYGQGFIIDRTLPVRQVQDNPVYGGLISSLDDAVGMVMDTLDRLRLTDNTIVIFTSDNGGVSSGDGFSTSNLPLRGGKGRQWEGGVRVPFIIMFPGGAKEAGRVETTPIIHMDIYPTILDLAGRPLVPSQHVDGVSLKPLLVQHKPLAPRTFYWHYPHYSNQGGDPASYLLDGDWKFIYYYEDRHSELYNLASDPGEQTPLNDKYPEKVKELKDKLDRWLAETGAKMPEVNPDFDPQAYRQQLSKKQATVMERVETLRRDMLKKDWQPDADWWGSYITKD